MITMTVSDDLSAQVYALADKLPAIEVAAVNRTAFTIRQAQIASMQQVFDRPTPWILNLPTVKPATPGNPTAILDVDVMGTHTHLIAERTLTPQIIGGTRPQKTYEQRLTRAGLLPAGMITVPGTLMPLDQYGNMAPGELTKILSWIGALDIGNRNPARRRRNVTQRQGASYFVAYPGRTRLAPGIYRRIGGQLEMMLAFAESATYQKRLPWFETTEQVYRDTFEKKVRAEIYQALGL